MYVNRRMLSRYRVPANRQQALLPGPAGVRSGSRNSPIFKDFFDRNVIRRYNSRPMSKRQDRLPVQVDPYRLAEQGREYDGMLPLRQMKRLSPLLESDTGEASVGLRFGVDEMGVHYLKGTIRVDLALQCQRCLEHLAWPVDSTLSLGFVDSTAEADNLPGGYEPYIVESVPLALIDLIEDELLLALPQIPMHDVEQCPAREFVEPEAQQDNADQDNPFQVLADLKTPDKG